MGLDKRIQAACEMMDGPAANAALLAGGALGLDQAVEEARGGPQQGDALDDRTPEQSRNL
jgi:hypothetical protein